MGILSFMVYFEFRWIRYTLAMTSLGGGGGELPIWYREWLRVVEVGGGGGERLIRNHPGTPVNNHLCAHVNYQAMKVIFKGNFKSCRIVG